MGDAQSAQREGKKDEAAEEESGKVDDAQAEQCTGDKPFKNNVRISEISEKAGISIAEVNGLCEDEVAADAVLSPDEDISETEIPLEDEDEEEEAQKDDERNEKESSNEVDVAEDVPLEMTEIDGKKNDINDGFRKFFSNIGLRLSIKRGSTDLLKDLPDETNNKEQYDEEPIDAVVKENESEIPEQNNDAITAQGTHDNDSTTGPTMTDITPEDIAENAEEKATEAKEEAGSDDAGEPTLPDVEETDQEATPEQGEVVSPIKKFFTTGIFSGLRKKRKPVEEETNEKEMIDMGKKDGVEVAEQTEEDQKLDKEQIDPGIEASAEETEHKEIEHNQEILSTTSPEMTDEGKSSTTDPSTDIVPEPESLNARERDRVPASPLKRLLSGSSFRKLSKKPRSRRSSDSRLSDSGEHAADQFMSSTESTENQKEEGPTLSSSEATEEEEGAWASFKKLLTPKKRRRASSLGKKEEDTPAASEKPKTSEGEQISDQSTDEDKKRKDSSVSWEAVLCGSGKKRSRKTSDSEDETPPNDDNKQEASSKPSAEPPQERKVQENSNERKNSLVSTTKMRSDGEGPTTWITFRRLVTPKRKAKEEDENKDSVQSDSEVSQEESSFSIKKLLPGRKKRKSTEKQDHVSSDEADKDVPSEDEDSETPAVVPLSEFDTPESMVQIQTQAEIESHFPEELDYEESEDLQQSEPVLPCDGVQNEAMVFEESKVETPVTKTPAVDKELDDDSEAVSKHQQLSDITEEGIITETMATPASVNEEAGRDDTIAEDLMEMTSEAITAPEPASATTLADETEMISAVSQLSTESSKTSGNTTPVPAEYEVMETDALLHQVVETISATPEAVPISSSNTKSESIVSSVLHQIFKTFVKEDKETAVLEIHIRSEATATTTMVEAVEELDEVKEPATAEAQTELKPEVNDSEVTEFLPEALEKLETAEVHDVQETAQGVGSVVEAPQVEMETASLELKEETEPQREVLVDGLEMDATKAEHALVTDVQISEHASKLDSDEVNEQPPEQVIIPDDVLPTETMTDETEKIEDSLDLSFKVAETEVTQEPEILPSSVEDTPIEKNAEEDLFMDAREITQSVDEGSVSLSVSKDTTDQVDASTIEDLGPPTEKSLEPMDLVTSEGTGEPELLQTEQARLLDTEELQQKMEISNEPDNKRPLEDTTEDEQEKEPEVLEAVQEPVICLEDTSVQSLPEDIYQGNVSDADGLKEESICLNEESFELLDVNKVEHVQTPDAFDTAQASSDSSIGKLPLPEEGHKDMSLLESVIDERKQETEPSVKPDNVQELEELPSDVVDTGIETSTEDFFVSVDEGSASLPTREVTFKQTEDIQEQEELQTLQPPPIDSQITNLLTLEKITTDDIPAAVSTDEPQKETEIRVEAQEELQEGGSLTENAEVTEELPSEVEQPAKDSLLDEPVITESVDKDIEAESSTGESLEPSESFTAEVTGDQEELESAHTILLTTEEPQKELELLDEDDAVVKDHIPEVLPSVVKDVAEENSIEKEETGPMSEVTESIEGISTTVPPIEESLKPMDLSTTCDQKQEEPQTAHELPLDSESSCLLPLGKKAENIPAEETIVEELQKETEVSDDASEIKEVEAVTVDASQEPEDLSSVDQNIVQETTSEEDATMLETEATDSIDTQRAPQAPAENIPESETIMEEIQKETEVRADAPETREAEDEIADSMQKTDDLPSPEQNIVQETTSEEGATVIVSEATDSFEGHKTPTTSTDTSPELVNVSKTEDAQEGEALSTEERSLLDSEEDILPPIEKETSEVIAAMDEQQIETDAKGREPEVSPSDVEDRVKDAMVEPLKQPQAENVQEREVLQSFVEIAEEETLTEKDTSVPALEVTKSVDVDSETVPVSEGSPESVDLSATEQIQAYEEPEPVETVEESSMDSEVCSPPLAGLKIEDISALEMATDEPKQTTVVKVEADTAEFVQEPGEQPSTLEDTDWETSNKGDTIQADVIQSTDEGSANMQLVEQSTELVDTARSENTQEPEEVKVEEEAESDLKAGSLQPFENVTSEDIPVAETVTDEPKEEMEGMAEPERELKITTEYFQQQEIPSPVKDVDLHTLAEEGATTQEPIITENTDEVFETTSHTAKNSEPVDISRTGDGQVPVDLNTVQGLPLDSTEGEMVLEKVIPEDKPAEEIITDELQKETDVRVEPQELSSVEADTLGTEQEVQSDPKASGLTFENVKSEDLPMVESVTDEPQKDTEEPIEPEEIETAEAFESQIQELEKIPSCAGDLERETADEQGNTTDMPVVTESIIECSAEVPVPEEGVKPGDALKTEQDQVQGETPTVEDSTLDSKVESLLPLDKELPEDTLAVETVTEEPHKEIYASVEPQDQQLTEAKTSNDVQEPVTLPSSVIDITQELVNEQEATIPVPIVEQGSDGDKAATHPVEKSLNTVDVSEKEEVQEPEVSVITQELQLDSDMGGMLPLEEVATEGIQAIETVTDEPQEQTKVQDEETEVLPLDVEDTMKDTMAVEGVSINVDVVTEDLEPGGKQMPGTEESGGAETPSSLEPQIEKMSAEDIQKDEIVADELTQETEERAEPIEEQPLAVAQTENDKETDVSPTNGEDNEKETKIEEDVSVSEKVVEEHIPQEDVDDAVVASADHNEGDAAAQLADISESHKTEDNQQGVQIEQEDLATEVQELSKEPQDHVVSTDEESTNTQVVENTIILEDPQAPSVDDAATTDDDKSRLEMPLSEIEFAIKGEKVTEDPSTETATLEHAFVPEIVTCFFKKVSETVLGVLPEKMSDSAEPVLDSSDFTEAAAQDSMVQTIHAPSEECADDHKIQVQVVDIKPTETNVDEVLEVEVTEMKEVMEVHHETIKEEDLLSVIPDTESQETVIETVTPGETQTTTEEVICVEDLQETVSKSAAVIVVAQPDAVCEVCELTESESGHMEPQEVTDDESGKLKEREDEAPIVISVDPATSLQVFEETDKTLVLLETKAQEVSETCVTSGEVKHLLEELDVKKVDEPEQSTRSTQGSVMTPSDTGLVVPQNTGIISSTGNFESPSSLSLEFKLNIQFGQTKAQLSQHLPSPNTDTAVKKKDVSEVGVQAEVPLKPVELTTLTLQEDIDPAVVKDQPTDAAESESTFTSAAKAVITTHPVQMNLGILTIETLNQMTTSVSPPLITERAESGIEEDVSEIIVQEIESVHPVPQRAENQKETEVNSAGDQVSEISEPVQLQDSTEKALSEPEHVEVGIHEAGPVDQVPEAPASPPPEEGTDEILEQLDASPVGVDTVELLEPAKSINLPQEAESQIQTEQTDVNDQPTEITEEAVSESTKGAVVTIQTEQMDDGTCTSETEEPAAEEKDSTHLQHEGKEQLPSTDVKETESVKLPNVSQRADSQIKPIEIDVHQTEITEQETHFSEETRAVITTQPVFDLGMCKVEAAEPAPKEPSSPLQIQAPAGALMEDLSNDEHVESADQITQRAESQIEPSQADNQVESEEHLGPVEGTMSTTHLMPLDAGFQEGEKEEPVTVAPSSPLPVAGETLTDVSEVADDDVKAVKAERQTEPAEILEVEPESKAPTSSSAIIESAEPLTPTEVAEDEVVEGLMAPTQAAEVQKEIELPEDDVLETKSEEPEEHFSVPDIIEGAVFTHHPALLDVGVHTIEAVDQSANAPNSSLITADEAQPLKQMDGMESDIQTEEASSTPEAESQKQSELPETSLQTESEGSPNLTQTAVIITQPVLLDDSLCEIKTVDQDTEETEDKEINPVEEVTASIQPTETTQPSGQPEEEQVVLSEPLSCEASDQVAKVTKEHAHSPEEENDQDVWLDAEEGDYTQEETEMPYLEVEENLESAAESVLEEEEKFEEEVEIDPNVQTEEEESQQEEYKTGEVCEIESEGEGEDFAIALEHQEFATANITTIEWD